MPLTWLIKLKNILSSWKKGIDLKKKGKYIRTNECVECEVVVVLDLYGLVWGKESDKCQAAKEDAQQEDKMRKKKRLTRNKMTGI